MTFRGFVMLHGTGRRVTAALGFGMVAALAAQGPAVAGAGAGETGSGGYEVTAQVTFTGDAAPGGGATQSVSVPATCWWESVTLTDDGRYYWAGTVWFDPENPEEALEARADAEAVDGSFPGRNPSYTLPTVADIEQAIADKAAGLGPSLFIYRCPDTDDYFAARDRGQIFAAYFNDPEPVPPPEVDPEDLAEVAYDAMVLPVPEVDRNPKADAGPGLATLVNLPTWFWVLDPASVGGDAGTRTIRAEVVGTPVFAELTARTDGLVISSPAGGTRCAPATAQVRYAPGISDDAACTVTFSRSSGSSAGHKVTASAAWTATWTGQDQDGAAAGGDLGGTTRSEDVTVPVLESQTVVTGLR